MYRLLVVDDEPIIVDGMYRLLQEEERLELDLYRAYSGNEALRLLHGIRFDIVLSDIRMPGMSGLELQEHIAARWPSCKVIFLTGHTDFEYVQTALRNKSVDYILKTESDEKVLRSVLQSVEALEAERRSAMVLDKASVQLQLALPTLQREYLLGFCEGTKSPYSLRPELWDDLHFELSLHERVLLVLGRVDHWPADMKASDKAILKFAIHNMAKDYLAPVCRVQSVDADQNRFFWLLQPLPKPDADWERTVLFVHGTLETIQETSSRLLKIPISIASANGPSEWSDLPARYDKLTRELSHGLGIGEETLIIERLQAEERPLKECEAQHQQIRNLVKRLTGSDFYFDYGGKEEFIRLLLEISDLLEPFYDDSGFFLEVYYAVASVVLAQANRWSGPAEKMQGIQLERLYHIRLHASRREAFRFLIDTAAELFDARSSDKDERNLQLVEKINRFVEKHLDSDLSLTTLSEIVYLNPYYMSRLYKQITGSNLSDYIAEARLAKAKQLVADSRLKMHEIAKAVGFDSPAYFTRIFKKKTGLTPNEYRELRRE